MDDTAEALGRMELAVRRTLMQTGDQTLLVLAQEIFTVAEARLHDQSHMEQQELDTLRSMQG